MTKTGGAGYRDYENSKVIAKKANNGYDWHAFSMISSTTK